MSSSSSLAHYDVVVVGAGISGIAAAFHLREQCPERSFTVLESQAGFGGTWRTHRYPGIRSDSDLYTFGYRFKPWMGLPIATAPEILNYMGEVIEENQLGSSIQYGMKVIAANWSEDEKRWLLTVEQVSDGTRSQMSAGFLWMCQGYYRHDQGYTPQWQGMENFTGQWVHPQTWPDDLDTSDKHVVVIGSGATAATVVPALAGQCKQLTMLQRSPTYFITGRNSNELAELLRSLDTPPEWSHEIVRRKVLKDQQTLVKRCISEPDKVRAELLAGVRKFLPQEMVDAHFTPRYAPWRQRIAFIPDGDLFTALAKGQACIKTDEIEGFESDAIVLKSGEKIHADVIVTATGFDLSVMGDIDFYIDDKPLDFSSTVAYRACMFSGVPNLAWVFGYFRASWTLRADLMADYLCRLFKEMDTQKARSVRPELTEADREMPLQTWFSLDNFNPGYLQRGLHLMPKQGNREPWVHSQDFWLDRDVLPAASLNDGFLHYR